MFLIGKAFKYQYDAGAAIDKDLPLANLLFMVVRNFK